MMEEFVDELKIRKGRCDGCKYCKVIYSNGGWSFLGCCHQPYHGKWVAKIKDCPKDEKGGAE